MDYAGKKILIISDLHLTFLSSHKKIDSFVSLVSKYDKIILNGDFLDDYFPYSWFSNKKFKKISYALLKKEVVYVFGNHDPDTKGLREKTKDFVNHYCEHFFLKIKNKKICVTHGNHLHPSFDDVFKNLKVSKKLKYILKPIYELGRRLMYPLFIFYKKAILKVSIFFKKKYLKNLKRINKKMKKTALEKFSFMDADVFISGHSHYAEAKKNASYYNSGSNVDGFLEYISIESGKIFLKKDLRLSSKK